MFNEDSFTNNMSKSNSEDSISIIKSNKNKGINKKGVNEFLKDDRIKRNNKSIAPVIINNDDINLESAIENLLKEHRTSKECTIIMKFLEGTELVKKFKLDKMEENQLYKLLYFVAIFAEYEFLKKDKFLFRQGDLGDKFFIILKGEVRVLKHKEKLIRLSGEEYIKKIISYYYNSEKDLLEKALKANREIYPIIDKDIPRLEEIFFRLKLRKLLLVNPAINELEKFFLENKDKIRPENFNIDFNELEKIKGEDKEKEEENLKLHFSFKRLSTISNNTELNQYRYLENTVETKYVKLYEYDELVKLSTGKYFGDYAMEVSNPTRYLNI